MALKILLADDNITAQKMGSKILTDAGYEVVAVSNGAAALKKIAAQKPGLLILDVYMPGYSGLEVCQKIKSAAETAAVPVVLTVTNMEPFNPEDGNKVKADGVMIKPFEASDLLAIVQKLEATLKPPAPHPPEPQEDKTAKVAGVEFQDASYEEWKAEAAPEEAEAPQLTVPQEMAAAPALGMEEMLSQAPAIESQVVAAGAAAFESGVEAAVEPAVTPAQGVEYTSAPPVGELEVAPAVELEPAAQAHTDVPLGRDPALVTDAADIMQFATRFGEAPGQPSFTPAEQIAETETAADLLETAEPAPAISAEASLEESAVQETPVTVETPVAVETGIEDSVQGTATHGEAAPVQEFVPEGETGAGSLEEEMRRAFDAGSGAAAAPALAPEPEPEPVVEAAPILEATPFVDAPPAPVVEAASVAAPPADIPDKLVEQFAAELAQMAPAGVTGEEVAPPPSVAEASAEPAPVAALDEQRVSEAVQRVMSRYKDELVAAIVRELKS